MKSILKKMSKAVQIVLAAPVKLPAKMVQVIKYVALALGVLETVVPDKENPASKEKEEDGDAANE